MREVHRKAVVAPQKGGRVKLRQQVVQRGGGGNAFPVGGVNIGGPQPPFQPRDLPLFQNQLTVFLRQHQPAVFRLMQRRQRLFQRLRQMLLHPGLVDIINMAGGIGIGGVVQVPGKIDDLAGGQQQVQLLPHRNAVGIPQLNIQYRQLEPAVLLPHRTQQRLPAIVKGKQYLLRRKIVPQPCGGHFPQLFFVIAYRNFYHTAPSCFLYYVRLYHTRDDFGRKTDNNLTDYVANVNLSSPPAAFVLQ